MAEKRKLQAEIDKTLKRVEEGIADFDDLVEKAHDATTPSQKEKLETELKREIKKLQRLRDQIKTWLAAFEVKDKAPLEDARRAIEKEMEKFKACEKLFKIKAFSKEGLAQQPKVDPTEAEREKHRRWIRSLMDKISTTIDFKEAELEMSKKRSRNKAEQERRVELERDVATLKWHMQKLDQVLRRLENESIEMSKLDELKDMLDCWADEGSSENEVGPLPLDDEIYAGLGLEDGSDDASAAAFLHVSVDDRVASSFSAAAVEQPETNDDGSKQTIKGPDNQREPRRHSDASQASPAASPAPRTEVDDASASPKLAAATLPSEEDTSSSSAFVPPQTTHAADSPTLIKQTDLEPGPREANTGSDTLTYQQKGVEPPGTPQSDKATPADVGSPPQSNVPATMSPEDAAAMDDLEKLARIVEAASQNLPTLPQRRHFRYYQPKTPLTDLPPSFPTQPLKNFATAEFFANLDLDTLFFTFYHQQGTYQQYLAARELKRKSWCYHKKYLTWFQPQSGPKFNTDRGPRGTYVYFDSETGWCSRVKNDFTFELCYLENEMPAPPPISSEGLPTQDVGIQQQQ